MWLSLLLFSLAAPPTKPAKPPPAAETAKLYFLAGDLSSAVEWANRGIKSDPKHCAPLLRALAEYEFLANHTDEFTPEQAREFIAYDRAISPGRPGKITEPVISRFITEPLTRAKAFAAANDRAQAKAIAQRVLVVDPKNAEAKALAR